MLSLTALLYFVLLLCCVAGSVVLHPSLGVMGYLLTYCINPAYQWWGQQVALSGIRYSYLLAIAIGIGSIIHRPKLSFGKFLRFQEVLLLIFLGVVWASVLFGLGVNDEESNALKLSKAVAVILMASHVITDLKRYEHMLWVFVIGGTYLGYQALVAPEWMFQDGRMGFGVGGTDFNEGNFLAAHFAMVLPFVAVFFLKGAWKTKLLCLLSGAVMADAIILCRSRGVFLALAAGVITAIVCAPGQHRRRIIVCAVIAGIGGLLLTNPEYWIRMNTISVNAETMDVSSQGRVAAWKAALHMVADHPLGIGEGNFKKYVGQYDPAITGVDTHNTYFRCLAELGIQGLFVYGLLIVNAFRILRRINMTSQGNEIVSGLVIHVFGLRVSLVVFLIAGFTITHTYIEELYWLIMLPVFLERALENDLRQVNLA